MRRIQLTALIIACSVAVAGPVWSVDLVEPTNWTGFKAGVLLDGDVELGDATVDQETSFLLQAFYDFPFGDNVFYGLGADILGMKWRGETDEQRVDETELLLDVGLHFKALLRPFGNRFAVRPGGGIGYGVMRRLENLNGSNFLTLKAYVEFVYQFDTERVILIDVGVWDAPTGGDAETDITIGPLAFVRAGIAF
ncbi:hypothetical protein GF377_06640 [candidate division GN15 bacterium]|nr:hypothetical protein [candidate division GN15 bacterium]